MYFMKILANDGMDKEGVRLFEDAGIEIYTEKRDLDSLISDVIEFDALVVRSTTEVTKEVIESGAKGKLKIIGRAGVGYDNVDVEAASENGIIVKFAPYGNTNSTAELAISLILGISRRIPQAHYSLKKGIWRKKPFKGTELSHKTLGIIGCGRIGQRLSELVLGFDMEVIGYDENIEEVRTRYPDSRIKYVTKDEVLLNSDYISIHVSGGQQIIGAKELSMMKPIAYIINAARGVCIDENALYDVLKTHKIAGAAIDVYTDEPQEDAKFNNKLRELENCVLSSHLGASTEEAQRDTSVEIARVIIDYLLKGDFSNSVNVGECVESEQRPIYQLFIHHRDVLGAFAQIDKVLSDYGINIRENPSRQVGKQGSVITVYLVHQEVGLEVIEALNKLGIVHNVKV